MQNKNISLIALSLFAASCASDPSMHDPVAPEARVAAKESPPPAPSEPPGTSFDQERRWQLSDPVAVQALSGTPFGEQEINEFWVRKGWRLTKKEDRYIATVDQLLTQEKIKKTTHWSMSPFTPVYATKEAVTIEGIHIPEGTEFWMDPNENEDAIKLGHPRFTRAKGYEEEHQGHADQASDGRDGQQKEHH